jgi:hypothetical protein
MVLVVAPFLTAAAPAAHAAAAPGSGLGGFRSDAEASGLDMTYNDGTEVNATFPDAETSFSTGTGHALAADFYPGPVGGNPGATIQQFLGADLPASIIQPLSTLQDNYKAEAYSSGPNDSSFPNGGPPQALTDTAHADDASATAIGTMENAGENVSARSSIQVGASSVTATATSSVSDISIAGVIHIGQVTSTATASSDGTKGKATGTSVISGVTVAGQAVSIGPKGLNVAGSPLPLDLSSVVNTAIKSLGITFSVSPTDTVIHGAEAMVHAPALTIFINPPQNQGNTFTLTLGGASAHTVASTLYVAPPVASPTPPPAASTPAVVPAAGGTSSDFGGGTSTFSAPNATGDNTSAFAPAATTAPQSTGSPRAIGFVPAVADFTGLKWGLVVFGLLLAGAAAFGMGKIPDDTLAEGVASPCPLERSSP